MDGYIDVVRYEVGNGGGDEDRYRSGERSVNGGGD